MDRWRALHAALVLLSLPALGCGEDVGSCKGEKRARDTVLVAGSIQYAGQAIINQACASCHNSTARGVTRQGAPAGLDFDLHPVRPGSSEIASVDEVEGRVSLSEPARARLRARQRKVLDTRDLIYQQVVDDLMPPPELGALFRTLVAQVIDSDDDRPCEAGAALAPTTSGATQESLRNWLACGAPIVEVTATEVKLQTAGDVGNQYPICAPELGTGPLTLEKLHQQVFAGEGLCVGCHAPRGQYAELDLSTPEAAYAALVLDTAVVCGSKPLVTKGSPEQSFLYEVMTAERPGCGVPRMPPGNTLSAAATELVARWIREGALRERDLADAGAP